MKRYNIFIIMVAMLFAGCTACKKAATGNVNVIATDNIDKSAPFWNKLLYHASSGGNNNVCLSPLSVQMAIAMTATGAEGETQEQMYSTIGKEICEEAERIVSRFNEESTECELNLANSIWINKRLKVKEDFINSNKSIYNAEIKNIPFDKNAIGKINGWCKENTNGKINEIIDRIDANNMMYLINALYFKAPWWNPFRPQNTQKQPFTTADGKVVEADMMKQSFKTSYYIDDTVQIATMPFQGGFEMIFILPRYKKDLNDAIRHLSAQYKSCTDKMEIYKVDFSVPKFKTEFSMNISDILYRMGMERAFGNEAQFGKISDEPLYIDEVIHKTFISIDESGAEAAAVTAVSMRAGAVMPREEKRATMTLDHPFIYAIKDKKTGTIFFVGTVCNPNKK